MSFFMRKQWGLQAPVCVTAVILFSNAASGMGGVNRWTSTGPSGGSVQVLAIDPLTSGTLYAGCSLNGVFKSRDGGNSWTAINSGLGPLGTASGDLTIRALAIDRSTPSRVYAGLGETVFKSVDGGETWTTAGSGLPSSGTITALGVDPSTPGTVYAGSSLFGVFKSLDAGASWNASNLGFPSFSVAGIVFSANVLTLVIDPAAPATLYVGTEGQGVFKSTDGGGHWSATNSGMGTGNIFALSVAPSSPSVLYAAPASVGVFRSRDSGRTWTAASSGLPTESVGAFNDVRSFAIDPSNPDTVYAGTRGDGIYKTTTGGAAWAPISQGPSNLFIGALAIDPSNAAAVYAGTAGSGVFKSTDRGASWIPTPEGLVATQVRALALDGGTSGSIYAGTTAAGAFKSSDRGRTWRSVSTGLTLTGADVRRGSPFALSLAVDPTNPMTLYAGGVGVFKSTNGGDTWSEASAGVGVGPVRALAIDPVHPSTIYAGSEAIASNIGGVYKSTDAAGSWRNLTIVGAMIIDSIVLDPSDSNIVYAGDFFEGVFRSRDGGDTWGRVNVGFPFEAGGVTALAVDHLTPATLYAGTVQGGVFKSVNRGETWSALNNGLANLHVSALALDSGISGALYAGTESGPGGVFKSTDGGISWAAMSAGLTNTNVFSLALDSGLVFAGTDAGVFTYAAAVPCSSSSTVLCLNGGRFRVQADWRVTSDGSHGHGSAVTLTGDTGYFWFFTSNNVELITKVVDGRAVNDRFWFFYGALSDVEYSIVVEDTVTGVAKTYFNPAGRLSSLADVSTF